MTHKDDCGKNICALDGDIEHMYDRWNRKCTVTVSSLNSDCPTCGRVQVPLQYCSRIDNEYDLARRVEAAFDKTGVLTAAGCQEINAIIEELRRTGNTIIIWIGRLYSDETEAFESVLAEIYAHDCAERVTTLADVLNSSRGE